MKTRAEGAGYKGSPNGPGRLHYDINKDTGGKGSLPTGLTTEEAGRRAAQGLGNRTDISTGKTTAKIIKTNVFTYFNLIFVILSILLCIVGSWRNLTFLPIVIINTVVGILQELRAKRTLDQMNMLNAPRSIVVRDQVQSEIPSDDLVKDDIVLLKAGNQICADAVVVQGELSVNESLLTGEADEIKKEVGGQLLSGSFVVSGQCYARLERVGNDSYISRLAAEAKAMGDGEQSEMMRSLNQLVKWIGIIIIPVAAILFSQAYFINHETFQKSIVSMVAAILGMIPEGLYLLTTAALALSTIRLAQKQVLLHDMKSIETLARVDVLCVDKTGTITEPGMQAVKLFASGQNPQGSIPASFLEQLLADYCAALPDENATMQAIRAYQPIRSLAESGKRPSRMALAAEPFSSARKYSTVTFSDGTYLLGAPEFIMKGQYSTISGEIAPYLQKGYRVLLIGVYAAGGTEGDVLPLGYLILSNPIRENAVETFAYFREQGVAVKVISGDNPQAVSEIAKRAGIAHADAFVDAGTLQTEEQLWEAAKTHTVFGRVTPKQKQVLVRALQGMGHTVAMTGDGVNDILAMKDADCSVAMASGSEAAAHAAQLVLLDSDFAHMPDVVLEGRRVVNNIQRSASLFLVKNIFSLLMAVFAVVTAITYPLEPAQISLAGMFTIGLPGFLLALEPNKNRIQGHFIRNVLLKAFPAGLIDVLAVAALVVLGGRLGFSRSEIATASTVLISIVGFTVLCQISRPFNLYKYGILALNISGMLVGAVFFSRLFAMGALSNKCILATALFSAAAGILYCVLTAVVQKLGAWYRANRQAEGKARQALAGKYKNHFNMD